MKVFIEIPDDYGRSVESMLSESIYTSSDDEQRLDSVSEFFEWLVNRWMCSSGEFEQGVVEDAVQAYIQEEIDFDPHQP